MALLRPTLGLPALSAPPVEPIVDDAVMTVMVKQTVKGNRTTTRLESRGQTSGVPYWAFEVAPGRPLRLGSLTVTVSPDPAPVDPRRPGRPFESFSSRDQIQGHARVEVRAPLPVAVAVESTPAARATSGDADLHNGRLPAGETVAHVPLRRSAEGMSWVRITPQYVTRTLIEVACRP
jgi:hypothetical protein